MSESATVQTSKADPDQGTDQGSDLRYACAQVSNVRAILSRNITRIEVEVPLEAHVECTRRLYGRDVFVAIADGTNRRYGLLGATEAGPDIGPGAELVHVGVATVKPIDSRQVSRIDLELGVEWHVEATRLLFGRDVILFAVQLQRKLPYGLISVTEQGFVPRALPSPRGHGDKALAPHGAPVQRTGGVSAGARGGAGARRMGLSRTEDHIDPVRWLGARCTEEDFQIWLDVRTEAAAIARVRELCEVTSRREIATVPAAREAFVEKIYRPFIQHNFDSAHASPDHRAAVSTLMAGGR